jgi:hypothetical protein
MLYNMIIATIIGSIVTMLGQNIHKLVETLIKIIPKIASFSLTKIQKKIHV